MDTNKLADESPRKPVWQPRVNVLFDDKPISRQQAVTVTMRRCICGATPSPSGALPCGH